jgi:hypothetical protein
MHNNDRLNHLNDLYIFTRSYFPLAQGVHLLQVHVTILAWFARAKFAARAADLHAPTDYWNSWSFSTMKILTHASSFTCDGDVATWCTA